MKYCNACDRLLLDSDYHKRAASPDGLQHNCRQCLNAHRRARRALERSRRPPKPIEYLFEQKRCSRCRIVKSLSDFHRKRAAKDGLQRYCRECQTKMVLATINVERARRTAREHYRAHHIPKPKLILSTEEQRAKWREQCARSRARKRAGLPPLRRGRPKLEHLEK